MYAINIDKLMPNTFQILTFTIVPTVRIHLIYYHANCASIPMWFVRGCNLSEVGGVLTHKQTLSSEVAQLVQEERRLDELIQRCTQEVKQMTESSQKYPFCCSKMTFLLGFVFFIWLCFSICCLSLSSHKSWKEGN